MTKKAKKCFIAILVAGAIALALGAVSSWYRNWKFSTWFNYWGKGAPAVTTTVDEGQAHAQKVAANAGLTHDSDFSAAVTAEVKQYDIPQVTVNGSSLKITTGDGKRGNSVRVTYSGFMGNAPHGSFILTDSRGGSYAEFQVSFAELKEKCGSGVRSLSFFNIGSGDYKDSNGYGYTLYIPEDGNYEMEMFMNGTNVNILFPAAPSNTNYTYYYDVEIASIDNTASDSFSSNSADENGLFTVIDTDSENYIDVDLTKLSFVNEIHPVCTVKATLQCKFGYNTIPVAFYCVPVNFGISKLATPTNVTYTNGTLSWNAVEGAEGYAVFNGNELYKTTDETSIELTSDNELEAGTYSMRVRALGNVGSTLAANDLGRMTAFNASSRITQVVTLTYDIDGDTVIKFVPLGGTIGDYLYDVNLPKKEFGGWFYDDGYSVAVNASDKLDKDTVIYARLSDKKVTERTLTWWDKYRWWVIGGAIALGVAGIAVSIFLGVKKDKKA